MDASSVRKMTSHPRWVAVRRPLAFTARMKRLLGATALIVAATAAAASVGVVVSPRLTAPFVALLALGVTAVPLVALAAANSETNVLRLFFPTDRQTFKQLAAQAALDLLRKKLIRD